MFLFSKVVMAMNSYFCSKSKLSRLESCELPS